MAGYNAYPYANTLTGGAQFNPYMNNQFAAQTPQTQNSNPGNLMAIPVNSEDEVNNYPVAAGTTVLLISFNLKKFWLKSTSTNGVPEQLRVFPFTEESTPPSQPQGVTRQEFEDLSKKIDKLISDLGGNANG